MPQAFASILFAPELADIRLDDHQPDYFTDLNLDQLVRQLCRGRSLERLAPLFWTRLKSADATRYRQEAIQEIEHPLVAALVARFVEGFGSVLQQLSLRRQVRFEWQQKRCLVDAADAYCAAVSGLCRDFDELQPGCEALRGLKDFAETYAGSAEFGLLRRDVAETRRQLDSVTYLMHVRGNRVHVLVPRDEPDLGVEVADLFNRFHDMDVTTKTVRYSRPGGFSHIDAAILAEVAELFPDQFASLSRFADEHADFLSPTIVRLAREVEFVLACLDFKARMEAGGLPMCYPVVTDGSDTSAHDCYDAALASSGAGKPKVLEGAPRAVVPNSFALLGDERVIVVTGPNQGGKTTFARMFGQLHHLAALGCPVPARSAQIGHVDDIFTLFERQEDAGSDRGKLQDDLIRMRDILQTASPHSVVILNEMFSSTSTDDALDLAQRVLDPLSDRGCRTLCVTFLDDLSSYRAGIVSMVADVDPDDPGHRLFTLTRRPADGRAYTDSLVAKYRLGGADLKTRIPR